MGKTVVTPWGRLRRRHGSAGIFPVIHFDAQPVKEILPLNSRLCKKTEKKEKKKHPKISLLFIKNTKAVIHSMFFFLLLLVFL